MSFPSFAWFEPIHNIWRLGVASILMSASSWLYFHLVPYLLRLPSSTETLSDWFPFCSACISSAVLVWICAPRRFRPFTTFQIVRFVKLDAFVEVYLDRRCTVVWYHSVFIPLFPYLYTFCFLPLLIASHDVQMAASKLLFHGYLCWLSSYSGSCQCKV